MTIGKVNSYAGNPMIKIAACLIGIAFLYTIWGGIKLIMWFTTWRKMIEFENTVKKLEDL